MKYVSKETALKYLSGNEMLFQRVKDSFLNSYMNFDADLTSLILLQDRKQLEIYIHSLKGISLNLGAECLYEQAIIALDVIRKGLWAPSIFEEFRIVLDKTYQELKSL